MARQPVIEDPNGFRLVSGAYNRSLGRRLSSFSDDRAHWRVSLMVEVSNGGMDGGIEMPDIAEGLLSQVVPLEVAPGALDIVQLGRVPGSHSTLSQGRAASACVVALLVWIGPLSSTSTTGRLARPGLGP